MILKISAHGARMKMKKNKENMKIRFTNPILFLELKKYFSCLDALKFCSAASTQANESVNNIMTSKAPKRVSYSTSESADFRFGATIAQKNCGQDYIRRSFDFLDISYNNEMALQAQKSQNKLFKRREKIRTPEYKLDRLNKQAAKSQLRNRKEQCEGTTYSSNMDLMSNQSTSIENCIETANSSCIYETDEFSIVFFDLETGGTKYEDDILQICMESGQHILNAFLTPTRAINPEATKVNGLSICQKKLF